MNTKAIAARESIAELAVAGLGTTDFLAAAGERLRRVVPYARSTYMASDPATLLPTALYRHGDESSREVQLAFAENEYLQDDYAKLTDLAVAERPVITLNEATGGDLTLSRRHREIHPLINAADELRVVFRSGGATWGHACLSRAPDDPDFSPEEQGFLASVAEDIGGALRLALQFDDATAIDSEAGELPGILVLRADDTIESTTPEADGWLAQLAEQSPDRLPAPVYHVVRVARAAAAGKPVPGPARGRIRLASGLWLMIRATVLRGRDGEQPRIAVVLEPARRAELATLMVMTYDLSAREREVTELLLRGLRIDAIAADLAISRHTVRDHTKAIFGKLGVTSRPELTAKLYHEHALPKMRSTA
jgi:DNA-binding CsgD family transcriptional regulator